MNKKRIVVFLALILVIVFALVLTSCKKEGEVKESPKATSTATPEVEKTATPTPPPTPTTAPTPKPLAEDQKGKVQADAEVLFKDEFEGDEISENAAMGKGDAYSIEDGKMRLSHDGSDFIDNWDTYSPDYYYEVGETHNQYEFHVKMQTSFTQDANHMSCFIGSRVMSSGPSIALEGSNGFFVAISKTKATLYPGTGGQWHLGKGSITLPETADTMHTYIVIDDGQCLYYYMVLNNDDNYLLFKADVSGEMTKITDRDDKVVLECDNFIIDSKGGYFSLFNHMGHTTVESVIVKGSR